MYLGIVRNRQFAFFVGPNTLSNDAVVIENTAGVAFCPWTTHLFTNQLSFCVKEDFNGRVEDLVGKGSLDCCSDDGSTRVFVLIGE